MKKMKLKKFNYKKILTFFEKKINVVIAGFIVILLLSVILGRMGIISKLLSFGELLNTGYTEETKTISVVDNGYNSDVAGTFMFEKSVEWTAQHEATLSFDIKTKEIPRNVNRDIILVLDTSDSMDEGRLNALREAVDYLLEDLFASGTNNRLALVTFDTTSVIQSDFTSDASVIKEKMGNLETKGATNYYLALKSVESVLSNYTERTNTDLHMIFVTDGFPTEGKNLYESQYKRIKSEYESLIATAIQLDMGEEIVEPIDKISDYQYYSYSKSGLDTYERIKDVLFDAARAAEYYDSIDITDYVYNDYFTVDASQSVEVPFGNVEIISEGDTQKFIWHIPEKSVKSGTIVELKFDVKIQLKDEYVNVEAYFPTNKSTTIDATASGIEDYSLTTSNTPVLQSWYEVVYNANVPAGCSTVYEKLEKYSPYETIKINGDSLSCLGQQFKGWEVADDTVTIINDEYFVMPPHNTEVGAKWTSLSISKSMLGTINTRATLYKLIASQAYADNVTSPYVTGEYGIELGMPPSDTNGKGVYTAAETLSDEYPKHYFRGNINNNNIIFGGFCWKIVMTTSTGGVKIIYNGTPTNGQCVATGEDTTIGKSYFNLTVGETFDGSLADSGYMYGNVYPTDSMKLGQDYWMDIVGLDRYYDSRSADYFTSSIYYSTSYSVYSDTYFELGGNISSATVSDDLIGKYTLFAPGTNYYSSQIRYVYDIDYDLQRVYYVPFTIEEYNEAGGQDLFTYFYNKAANTTWIYGNDVTYDSSTGIYTLVDTIALKPINYGDNIAVVNGDTKYHYTCMKESASGCSEVYYIHADVEKYMQPSYILLTGGKKVEDALAEMTYEAANIYDSNAKSAIDTWFAANLNKTEYLNMIEDTVYCNQRKQNEYNADTNGWNKDGDTADNDNLFFIDHYGFWYEECSVNDSFTVSSENGNGKLTYPVGLLNTYEAKRAGSISTGVDYLQNGLDNWLMTPRNMGNIYLYMFTLSADGGMEYEYSFAELYLRPVISLKHDVYVSDGDGSTLNPYILEMEE